MRRAEGDAVVIHHDGGLAKVFLAEIPDESRAKYQQPTAPVLDAPLGSNDLLAADGQIYRNFQIRKIEPDGLTLRHDSGLTKVLFPLLPVELQTKYEYDPQTAAAYQKSMAAAARQAESIAEANRKKNEAARKKQIQAEPIRVYDVSAVKTGKHQGRVRFSVRNYDDKPREFFAKAGPLSIKQYTVPANSSLTGLELTPTVRLATYLEISSHPYRVQHLLNW